jgi:hypothetical protein
MGSKANAVHREPWNKGKIVDQKAPFKPMTMMTTTTTSTTATTLDPGDEPK